MHDKQARTPCLLRETRERGDPANRAGNEGSTVCPRSLHPAPGAGPGGPHGAGESRGALSGARRRTAACGRTPRSDARPPRGPPPPHLPLLTETEPPRRRPGAAGAGGRRAGRARGAAGRGAADRPPAARPRRAAASPPRAAARRPSRGSRFPAVPSGSQRLSAAPRGPPGGRCPLPRRRRRPRHRPRSPAPLTEPRRPPPPSSGLPDGEGGTRC